MFWLFILMFSVLLLNLCLFFTFFTFFFIIIIFNLNTLYFTLLFIEINIRITFCYNSFLHTLHWNSAYLIHLAVSSTAFSSTFSRICWNNNENLLIKLMVAGGLYEVKLKYIIIKKCRVENYEALSFMCDSLLKVTVAQWRHCCCRWNWYWAYMSP